MASSGVSFKSIKDKLKHTSIGETVTEKLNSIRKHDSTVTEQSGVSPTHHARSPSSSSIHSVDFKDPLSSKPQLSSTEVDGDSHTEGAQQERRHSFEMVDEPAVVKEATRADLFEHQLTQLQDQLVNSMIENQNMSEELKILKNDKQVQKLEKDLDYERKKNNELLSKISVMAQHATRRTTENSEEANSAGATDYSMREESGDCSGEDSAGDPTSLGWTDRLFHSLLQRYYQIVEDFSVTSEDVEEPEVVEALAVKKLKDNVKRFGTGISPIFDTMSGFRKLFNWHTPLLTGTIFMVYMYACWSGFLIPGLLSLVVFRLFLNLLEEWKLIPTIYLLPHTKKEESEKEKESSVSDKFNVVLDVATKVQNQLGHMADGTEKLKNFLTWKRPEDTKQLFVPLCAAATMSLFLRLDTVMFVLGTFLGIKLFVIDPVYNRFPRVRDRYDSTHKLWQNLLTDAELERYRQLKQNHQMVLPKNNVRESPHKSGPGSRQSSTASFIITSADSLTEEDRAFCERFHLPPEECPIPNTPFKGGRHCVKIDKTAEIRVTTAYHNHAKLYLTHSFLCYEMVRQDERKAIPLSNITRVEKKKPISFIPGKGMSLEITEQGFDKPHVFGGLLHRDDCYNTLMELGRGNGLQYAQQVDHIRTDSLRLSELADDDNSDVVCVMNTVNPPDKDNFTAT